MIRSMSMPAFGGMLLGDGKSARRARAGAMRLMRQMLVSGVVAVRLPFKIT